MTTRTAAAGRPGYALVVVLLVIVILSLAAYRFTDAMTAEYRAAARTTDTAQARANAVSGVHYAVALLADPDAFANTLGGNPYDNEAAFRDITAVSGGDNLAREGRFSVVRVEADGQGGFVQKFGVGDEGGKLNPNALMQVDKTGKVLFNALLVLPNMTEEVAAAIVDWLDADDEPYNGLGAESSYYTSLPTPYRPKNAPLSSLDELLLVRGVTPALLYGTDRNRNGVADDAPGGSQTLDRGWADYLTVYGRYLNVDSTGTKRINLKQSDELPALYQQLTAAVGQEMAAYIMAYKLYGGTTVSTTGAGSAGGSTSGGGSSGGSGGSGSSGTTSSGGSSGGSSSGGSSAGSAKGGTSGGGGSQATTRAATTAELVTAVELSLSGLPKNKQQPKSVSALANTRVTLPKPPAVAGQPAPPTLTYTSPLSDPAKLAQILPVLLDKTSVTQNLELVPRINVNTAPREVLLGIPGMTAEYADGIINARAGQSPTDPATLTGAWLVTAGGVPLTAFQRIEPYVTGQSSVYRIQSLGYAGRGGPVARVEAVVDVNQGAPRVLAFRDLADLDTPRGFEPPRR